METFVAAYVVVLLGFTLFLTRMRIQQKRLQKMVDLLQTRRTTDHAPAVQVRRDGNRHGNDSANAA